MLLSRQHRQSDIMFLLTSQFIKLLVHADSLNSTNYQLHIENPCYMWIQELYTDAICIILHVPVTKKNIYIYLILF